MVIGANVLTRWKPDAEKDSANAFFGTGIPRDNEVAGLEHELKMVKTGRDFIQEAVTFFARESS